MKISKVISGAQTGADFSGIKAAKYNNIPTGGYVPKGYLTEDGLKPELAEFGILCTESDKYPPRTKMNVEKSDATIIFQDIDSNGCRLTKSECVKQKKPYVIVSSKDLNLARIEISKFIENVFNKKKNPIIINIAGNRESKSNGIGERVFDILCSVFSEI